MSFSQLSMLSDIFPRHIIEFISFGKMGSAGGSDTLSTTTVETIAEQMGQLARTHQDVTIMFMDIVGGWIC